MDHEVRAVLIYKDGLKSTSIAFLGGSATARPLFKIFSPASLGPARSFPARVSPFFRGFARLPDSKPKALRASSTPVTVWPSPGNLWEWNQPRTGWFLPVDPGPPPTLGIQVHSQKALGPSTATPVPPSEKVLGSLGQDSHPSHHRSRSRPEHGKRSVDKHDATVLRIIGRDLLVWRVTGPCFSQGFRPEPNLHL